MKILVIAAILFFGYRLVTKNNSLDQGTNDQGVLEDQEDEDFTNYEEIE